MTTEEFDLLRDRLDGASNLRYDIQVREALLAELGKIDPLSSVKIPLPTEGSSMLPLFPIPMSVVSQPIREWAIAEIEAKRKQLAEL